MYTRSIYESSCNPHPFFYLSKNLQWGGATKGGCAPPKLASRNTKTVVSSLIVWTHKKDDIDKNTCYFYQIKLDIWVSGLPQTSSILYKKALYVY